MVYSLEFKTFVAVGLLSFSAQCFSFPQVIVNLNSMHLKSLSLNDKELIDIYTMRKKVWADGTHIKVFALPSRNPIHQDFVKNLLKSNIYKMDRVWNRLTFSGRGKPPIIVGSEEELIKKVQSVPGAIGYIANEQAIGDLKKIKVNGL